MTSEKKTDSPNHSDHHNPSDLIKSPTGEVVPHPALDLPISSEQEQRKGIDWVVFGIAAAIAIAFMAWGFINTEGLSKASDHALGWVLDNAGWFFVLTASAFVVYIIWLAASKYGNIPLGRDDEKPEFKTASWIAMMFSAGMGIGLMFYGVGEPLWHFVNPPPGTGGAGNPEAIEHAMSTTMFHWTLHPWAIYAVVGLAIGYGAYRKGRVSLISSAFTSLLGKRTVEGPVGKTIDIFAIFATLFGSATSLGTGAYQISAGLQIVAEIGKVGNAVLIGIITVLTVCFVISAVTGVAKGIQWLSNINMVLALLLALFLFVVGPTVFILDLIPTSLGAYVGDLAQMSARTGVGGAETSEWLGTWTIFYWAWWISWTPFVGMFIARISRGRTIRQFVSGVLLVPSAVSVVWFCIFGGTAIDLQRDGADIFGDGAAQSQLFTTLEQFPLATVMSILVMVLVAIFFISGADAASIVMGTLSERGTEEPKRLTVIFWGVATGVVAILGLIAGGEEALGGLQTITIVAALPFTVIMVGLVVALQKDLQSDPIIVRGQYAAEAVEQAVITGVTEHGDDFALAVIEDDHSNGSGNGSGSAAATVPADKA
ncbi:choline/carnitine/betaine transporter family protein [Nocardioidaceae bacterium Broad-1]|nr:choline/carnitine/betaine transporter family protein [Nocardioidaceae bacterium Broad-1]